MSRNWLEYARENLYNQEENILIRQVLSKIDIIEKLSKKLEIDFNKKGYVGIALCPYHPESTGSLCINKKYGVFYCFSCGSSGKLFDLWLFVDPYEACKEIIETEYAKKIQDCEDPTILEHPFIFGKKIEQNEWDRGIDYLKKSNMLLGLKRAFIENCKFLNGYKGFIEIDLNEDCLPLANNCTLTGLCNLFSMIGGNFPFVLIVNCNGKKIKEGRSD